MPKRRGEVSERVPGTGPQGGAEDTGEPEPQVSVRDLAEREPSTPELLQPQVRLRQHRVAAADDPRVKVVLAKIHKRLEDPGELVRLHLKHYHMNLKNFKE